MGGLVYMSCPKTFDIVICFDFSLPSGSVSSTEFYFIDTGKWSLRGTGMESG